MITCPDCGQRFTGPTEASAIVRYEDHLPCQHWLSTVTITLTESQAAALEDLLFRQVSPVMLPDVGPILDAVRERRQGS